MEKKRTKISSSLRSIFSRKFFTGLFLSYSNKQAGHRSIKLESSGFTLVELLLVVAILGILASGFIVIINPGQQLKNSRDARRKSDLKQIQSALELYRADCGSYPSAPPNALPSPFVGTCGGSTVTYMESVPRDPRGSNYYYQNIPAGNTQRYALSICLENSRDTEQGTFAHSGCPSGLAFQVNNP